MKKLLFLSLALLLSSCDLIFYESDRPSPGPSNPSVNYAIRFSPSNLTMKVGETKSTILTIKLPPLYEGEDLRFPVDTTGSIAEFVGSVIDQSTNSAKFTFMGKRSGMGQFRVTTFDGRYSHTLTITVN